MSIGAQPASGAAYRVLRELGARAHRTFAAIREPHELVVLHRFARNDTTARREDRPEASPVSAEQLAILLRDAQSLAKNWHPNIARVKHVELARPGELSIATELVDGATLDDLLAIASTRGVAFRLDVLVRILLDVLAGIHGVHGLRDDRNVPLGVIHGELCPANIVVGRDGIARIINVLRPRPLRIEARSEAIRHVAPESLDGGAADARADVYAVGVILWEALTGKKLHGETEPGRVLAHLRESDVARPETLADASFAPLVDVAMRAVSFEPSLRFRTAAEMAAMLRQVPSVASGSFVAGRVNELDGERIRGRRATFERTSSGSRPRLGSADPVPPAPPSSSKLPPSSRGDRDTMVPTSAKHLRAASASPQAVDPTSVDLILVEEPTSKMEAAVPPPAAKPVGADPPPPPKPGHAKAEAPKPAPPKVVSSKAPSKAAVSAKTPSSASMGPGPARPAMGSRPKIGLPSSSGSSGGSTPQTRPVAFPIVSAAAPPRVTAAPPTAIVTAPPAAAAAVTAPPAAPVASPPPAPVSSSPVVAPPPVMTAPPAPLSSRPSVAPPPVVTAPPAPVSSTPIVVPPAPVPMADLGESTRSTEIAVSVERPGVAGSSGLSASLDLDAGDDDVATAVPTQKKRRGLWIGLVAAVFLLCTIVLLVGFRSRRVDDRAAPTVEARATDTPPARPTETAAATSIETPSAATTAGAPPLPSDTPAVAPAPEQSSEPTAPTDTAASTDLRPVADPPTTAPPVTPTTAPAVPAAPTAPRTQPSSRRYEPLGI